ncbi:MAG: hypothetical protein WA194_05075 [Patescibacteria group bacterium]
MTDTAQVEGETPTTWKYEVMRCLPDFRTKSAAPTDALPGAAAAAEGNAKAGSERYDVRNLSGLILSFT